jgi:alkylation response protein AidB-like acyl-CoA dehydrogenase
MKEVLPVANELGPQKGEIPMELRQKMAELGYFGIRIPEEYGGLGRGGSEDGIARAEQRGLFGAAGDSRNQPGRVHIRPDSARNRPSPA